MLAKLDEGCPSCSFLADHYDGAIPHLNAPRRNAAVISRAPLSQIQAFQNAMAGITWVSSTGTIQFRSQGFLHTTGTSKRRTELQLQHDPFKVEEGPASVVYKRRSRNIFHTYQLRASRTFSSGTYNFLDFAPKPRRRGSCLQHGLGEAHDKYRATTLWTPSAATILPPKCATDATKQSPHNNANN